MVKKNKPYNPRRSTILTIGLSDSHGTFYKGKGPLETTEAHYLDYVLEKGLRLDIPGGRDVRRKKDKR